MARKKKTAPLPEVEALRPYLDGVAKKLADDLWGPKGPPWGTTLTELEDIILRARGILTDKLLALSLERQAEQTRPERPAELQECPSCQRPFAEPSEHTRREMQTRVGAADWQEPREYCTRCRRAFFPSEQKSGH